MNRDFCKPLFNPMVIKKATKTTVFERICLSFIKAKFKTDETTTLKYKVFRGKIYILEHFINPPKGYNCRHHITPII